MASKDSTQTCPHSKSVASQTESAVLVNCAYGKLASMNVADAKLLEYLLVDERRPIVIFRQSNITFSIALAALRGSSWDGIVSTVTQESPVQNRWVNNQKLSIKYCVFNAPDYKKSDSDSDRHEVKKHTAFTILDRLLDLPSPPHDALIYYRYAKKDIAERLVSFPGYINRTTERPLSAAEQNKWQIFCESTTLPTDLCVKNKIVWYQCPWIASYVRKPGREIYDVILEFLKHVAEKQSKNDYVLIGIVKQFPYITEYRLHKLELIGDNPLGPVPEAYDFLGVDKTLIEKIVRFGYKHESVNNTDIHEKLLRDHLTLVFRHK